MIRFFVVPDLHLPFVAFLVPSYRLLVAYPSQLSLQAPQAPQDRRDLKEPLEQTVALERMAKTEQMENEGLEERRVFLDWLGYRFPAVVPRPAPWPRCCECTKLQTLL